MGNEQKFTNKSITKRVDIMDKRILHYMWLSNALYAGSNSVKTLFAYFKNIHEIYEADKDDYKSAGLKTDEIMRLCNKDLSLVETQYNYCKREHIGFLCYDDPYYPERLKIINNPPCMFYYRGRLLHIDDYPCFAFVGTRKCSEDGFRLAYRTAYTASAQGAVIVNGLADGIDGACIAAALDANGYAIGVLGSGIDRIYPEKNRELFHRLSASGLIITEFPPFTKPLSTNFPVRNRVISGLCLATAVFEAELYKSGALISARHALEQGRGVFAVPGSPDDVRYSGPLDLIKDGANILTEAEDLLCEYSLMFPHRLNMRHVPDIPEELLKKHLARCFDLPDGKKSVERTVSVRKKSSAKKEKIPVAEKTASESQVSADNIPPVIHEVKEQELINKPATPKIDMSLLSATEKLIADLFTENGELSADDICAKGFKIDDVLSSITLLEVYGYIHAIPGGRYKLS